MNKDTCLTSDEISGMLKSAGLSATSQRIGLCRYVLCEAKHPTVDDVRAWAANQGLKTSLATVYNTLHALCKAGMLKDLRFPHSEKVIYDNNIEPHHHFLDEDTGSIVDIPLTDFDYKNKLGNEFEVHDVDIIIRGKIKLKD
ncbi:MAG: transcriptional repressor [Lentisphaeraceae bacterium]|nr:transcriptional repressor [Lentisphaeraceae bacterium]